jgi:hypothetical protein
MPIGGLPTGEINTNSQIVLIQKENIGLQDILAFSQASAPAPDPKAELLKSEAEAIDAYFEAHAMPLLGTGMTMAQEAERNGLDWRLLAAIAVRESTGGKHDCKRVTYNPFGWASCKVGFKSNEEAISIVAKNLGGNNPKTERHYSGKTTIQILKKYNPPAIVPRYAEQVLSIMNKIGPEKIILDTPASSSALLAQKG